jgi:soluble epoxide hydrolase / lipid-phosphate phosphatase
MKRRQLLIGGGAFAMVGATVPGDDDLRRYARGGSVRTVRHKSFYLEAGPRNGPVIIFVHGWPEISRAWRSQIRAFSSLGFRVIAPDLRGCGRSSLYSTNSAYSQRKIVQDMIELVNALDIDRAIWVGHDWGAAVVWNVASHRPDRCLGVAALTVPYDTLERGVERLREIGIDRTIYPETQFPYGKYEYYKFYQENFAIATRDFEANVENTMKILLRQGDPTQAGQPSITSFVRLQGGWFGPTGVAPSVPLDTAILTQADLAAYVEAYERTGFFGANSLYMNDADNVAYANEAKNNGILEMPALFISGNYDYINPTEGTNILDPMKAKCQRLTIRQIDSGHWMQHERAADINKLLSRWIAVNKL